MSQVQLACLLVKQRANEYPFKTTFFSQSYTKVEPTLTGGHLSTKPTLLQPPLFLSRRIVHTFLKKTLKLRAKIKETKRMFRPNHSDFISVVFVSFRFLNFCSEFWNCLYQMSSPELVKKPFAKSTH